MAPIWGAHGAKGAISKYAKVISLLPKTEQLCTSGYQRCQAPLGIPTTQIFLVLTVNLNTLSSSELQYAAPSHPHGLYHLLQTHTNLVGGGWRGAGGPSGAYGRPIKSPKEAELGFGGPFAPLGGALG